MHRITIQRMVPKNTMPSASLLKKWAHAALDKKNEASELNIRIVDTTEITELNTHYRHKAKITNVLSFPFDMPEEAHEGFTILGDIVICADVVNQEAIAQNKTNEAHWAHIVIHGTLHLLGFDHEIDSDAIIMESNEIDILATLGIANPYQLIEKGTEK